MERLRTALRALLADLKHPLLDYLHPPPARLRLDAGTGVRRAIVERVLAETDLAVERRDSDAAEPCLWIDDDAPLHGWAAVCRYLGRLWRLHPVHPANAAHVDSALEILQELVARLHGAGPDAFIATAIRTLDARLACTPEGPWLEGMADPTVADVCWAGALEWLAQNGADVAWEGNSHVARWWLVLHDLDPPSETDMDTSSESDADADAPPSAE